MYWDSKPKHSKTIGYNNNDNNDDNFRYNTYTNNLTISHKNCINFYIKKY